MAKVYRPTWAQKDPQLLEAEKNLLPDAKAIFNSAKSRLLDFTLSWEEFDVARNQLTQLRPELNGWCARIEWLKTVTAAEK